MQRQLLAGHAPESGDARMSNHGSAMCRVRVDTQSPVHAKAGAMVAYTGFLAYQPVTQSLRRAMGEWASGERSPLLTWEGDGDLYLADQGADVLVLRLAEEELSVNGEHLLAMDSQLQCRVDRIKGVALAAGGGLFNAVVSGTGWVAVSTNGVPVVLDCAEAETYVDPDALVAWSGGLTLRPHRSIKMGSLIGRGSGEALQIGFKGAGFVVVQPSEETGDRLKIRG